jgi:phosphopantetheine adenylyltransferase
MFKEGNMFSIINRVDFFEKSLKRVVNITVVPYKGVIITLVPYKRSNFEILVQA